MSDRYQVVSKDLGSQVGSCYLFSSQILLDIAICQHDSGKRWGRIHLLLIWSMCTNSSHPGDVRGKVSTPSSNPCTSLIRMQLSLLSVHTLPPFPPEAADLSTTTGTTRATPFYPSPDWRPSIPGYVLFSDLTQNGVQNGVSMVVDGREVANFWSGVPDLQEWVTRIVLNEINLAIYAWSNSTSYGQRVHESGGILRLFGMLERLGMHAEIPEVTWDVRGHRGLTQVERIVQHFS
jgi:hypothetical protein